ncbi:LysR family transcriptional regulator [Labrys wisconsinensis]|uniref:DNA-binding transcriptional LysR family regulator n=1 Tax=Labrys wisconsinensis TaxID=425677 RepID=A0ABU0J8U4_9HYPH|nr:LysR family transcriptional regulator [Labrys wisconsinensis]MDQ0470025.1 DNA-binding transcriptional LysR family regulator [Labrys wisconsinensis]
MIRTDGVLAFVAVVEGGSISEAARRLRLAKSVVSERLIELERTLGGTLLRRSTRRLSLTEDGAAFLERARRILGEMEGASADMAARRGLIVGPLRISAPVTFGRLHLGPALYPFLAEHPGLELTLDLDDRRADVSSSGFDAVIRHGAIEDTRLIVWRLAPSRRLLAAAPGYLDRHGTPTSLAELERHRGIFYSNRGVADWRFRGEVGSTITASAQFALGINNGDMMRDAAIAGLGIALLPAFIAAPALRDGLLVEIDVGCRPDAEFIYMAHAEGRTPPAKLRALAEHLRRVFGHPPYWETGLDHGAQVPP